MAALDCEYHDRDGTEGVGMTVAVSPEAIAFLLAADTCHSQGSKFPLGGFAVPVSPRSGPDHYAGQRDALVSRWYLDTLPDSTSSIVTGQLSAADSSRP